MKSGGDGAAHPADTTFLADDKKFAVWRRRHLLRPSPLTGSLLVIRKGSCIPGFSSATAQLTMALPDVRFVDVRSIHGDVGHGVDKVASAATSGLVLSSFC